jgi:hypothetical protein
LFLAHGIPPLQRKPLSLPRRPVEKRNELSYQLKPEMFLLPKGHAEFAVDSHRLFATGVIY